MSLSLSKTDDRFTVILRTLSLLEYEEFSLKTRNATQYFP
jgi:hypothetical protein